METYYDSATGVVRNKQYLTLVEAPEELALSVADLKKHLRLRADDTTEDADLETIIMAATQQIDGAKAWLGRALVTQTWRMILDQFPCGNIIIPLPPLQEVVSVKYIDGNGDEQTMVEDTDYEVVSDVEPAFIKPVYGGSWPAVRTGAAVRVEFVCGYGDDDTDVPELIKKYLKIICGDLYQNRESNIVGTTVAEVPHFREMLENLRVRGADNETG